MVAGRSPAVPAVRASAVRRNDLDRVHPFRPWRRSVSSMSSTRDVRPYHEQGVGQVHIESSTRRNDGDAVVDAELAEFVREHYPRLIRLAGQICREPRDAADAVQNALEQAWRRRATLRDRNSVRPWLDRTVVREAIRMNPRPRSLVNRLAPGPREIDVSETLSDPRARHEGDTELRIAFDALAVDQRVALVLHLYAGYTVEETASIVGAPIETVRARLRRGRERLRALLGDAR
jgi:RNA polymerase sigma-70 factor, ECF subfamily